MGHFMSGTVSSEHGSQHLLLQRGREVALHLSPCLLLTKLECESWLEMMTAAEIDKVLADIDKIVAAFDAKIEEGRYSEPLDEYIVPVLPSVLYGRYKDKSQLPKAADIPLSVKICGMQRWTRGLTRQHLLAAAYRRIVNDYYQWETVTDVLNTAYAHADENGYHISIFYNPVAVFELMADVSALLALASHADIAANGVINFTELGAMALANKSRKQAAKSAQTRGANRQKLQQAFWDAIQKNPKLSARQFAIKNYVAYGYKTLEGAIKALTGKEFKKFKASINLT